MKPIRKWTKIQLADRCLMPNLPGLYAICKPNWYTLGLTYDIKYIGRSIKLRSRWASTGHHRYYQALRNGCHLRYTLVPLASLNNGETTYIKKYDPPWNNTPKPNKTKWPTLFDILINLTTLLAFAFFVNLINQ